MHIVNIMGTKYKIVIPRNFQSILWKRKQCDLDDSYDEDINNKKKLKAIIDV